MICLATCWDGHEEARGTATRDNAPDKLETLLTDPTPEVRAAAVMALGTFIQVDLLDSDTLGKLPCRIEYIKRRKGISLFQNLCYKGSSL